jgi:hypothetical protein
MADPINPHTGSYRVLPLNIDEYESYASKHLQKQVYDYYRSGANDEHTLADNRHAYARLLILPRVMVNVEHVDRESITRTTPATAKHQRLCIRTLVRAANARSPMFVEMHAVCATCYPPLRLSPCVRVCWHQCARVYWVRRFAVRFALHRRRCTAWHTPTAKWHQHARPLRRALSSVCHR